MSGTLVVVGVAVLAGCQPPESAAELEQQGTESSTSGSAPRSPERPAPPPLVENGAVRELVGEYRLAGVDGQNIDLPHGISAVITTDRIEIAAGCVRFAWSYQFDGGNLATKSLPAASCKRGLYPEEEAVKRAFDAAERVERTPANGILLSGDGHSVTIFSQ